MSGFASREVLQRARERRECEDSARRLIEVFPSLVTLRLEIREARGEGTGTTSRSQHVRHIVVASAPAFFDIPCIDRGCQGGSHDITHAVLRGLSQSLERFEGDSTCTGEMGSAYCGCGLIFTAFATYAHADKYGLDLSHGH